MKRQARATREVAVDRHSPAPWRADGPEKPFAVECCKSDGRRWTLFSRYTSRAEAHQVAARLQAIGCPTRVVADR